LRLAHYQSKRERLLRQQQATVRRIHNLEKEIARLQAKPPNAGRAKAVVYLEKQLLAARA
jgi:hypothetical protein